MKLAPTEVRPPLSLWARQSAVSPPPAAVISAILDYGDVCEPRDDGFLLVRVSPSRAAQICVDAALAGQRQRLLDVSIVWDEQEQQIVSVVDASAFRVPADDQLTGNAYADARLRGFPRHIVGPCAQAEAA